jgi:hypothetical protein
MKNKNLILLSLLATMLISGAFISIVAAQEDKVDPEPIGIPDPELIAPALDDNSTITDGASLYTITDDNQTIQRDSIVTGTEDANLIATNTLSGSDNTLAIAAIGVLSAVIVVGAIGVVSHRRSASKQQI